MLNRQEKKPSVRTKGLKGIKLAKVCVYESTIRGLSPQTNVALHRKFANLLEYI